MPQTHPYPTSINRMWIDDDQVFQARPIEDCVNDGHPQPENKRIKWVVFLVFAYPNRTIEYDAVGYATSIKSAMSGQYVN